MLSSSRLPPRPFPHYLLYPAFRTPMDPVALDSSDFPAIHPNINLGDSFPRLFDLPPPPDSSGFPAIHPNIVLEDSFPRLFDLLPSPPPCPSTIICGPGLGGPPGQFAGGGGGGSPLLAQGGGPGVGGGGPVLRCPCLWLRLARRGSK
jgi:hypothetical protein